jgi:hypothetical protein
VPGRARRPARAEHLQPDQVRPDRAFTLFYSSTLHFVMQKEHNNNHHHNNNDNNDNNDDNNNDDNNNN